jgi:ubiquinone/menaquinone biosynthesis C-methylase UbiE
MKTPKISMAIPGRSSIAEIQESYQGDKVAAEYVRVRFQSELMALLHERQLATVQGVMANGIERTLEIAPGPGRITRDVKPSGALVCLEFNEGMIEKGREVCAAGVQWVRGNAFELPFREEFDFVYSFRFIRHFHRDDRERLYAQVRKVLKPRGWFVMDAVNEKVSGPLRAADPEAYPIYDKLYRDEAELRSELSAAGFEVVCVEPVQRWFRWQYRAQILLEPRSRTLCRWAIRILERLRRGPALEWIVTCRRA